MKRIFVIIVLIFLVIVVKAQIPETEYMPITINSCTEVFHAEVEVTAGESDTIPIPQNNYRRIYFVHGLGGNASSMEQMSNAFVDNSLNIFGFPARKCLTSRPEYSNSTGSLVSGANTVREYVRDRAEDDIVQYAMNPDDAFLIGHSQGGMVLRTMAHLDLVTDTLPMPSFGKGYNGMVTMGAPLQGGKILNNRNLIINMSDYACRCLIEGPTSSFLVNLILKKTIGREYGNSVSAVLSSKLLPVVFGDYFDGITNYYKVGAPWIDSLNSDVSNLKYMKMPKVAFYAVEPQSHIFWRTSNWLVNNPNNEDAFEANEDWTFYNDIFGTVYAKYYAKYQKVISKKKKIAWKNGVDWFNTVDPQWQVVIGARQYHMAYRCKCPRNAIGRPKDYVLKWSATDCINSHCDNLSPVVWYEVNSTVKENDGIVLAESAANLPGYTGGPVRVYYNEYNYQARNRGTSHMQMRNDGGIKEKLYNLLEGNYGHFFKTGRKQM